MKSPESKSKLGKRAFPRDFLLCSQWCEERGLRPFCDFGIRQVIVKALSYPNYPPLPPEDRRICDKILFLPNEAAREKCRTDPKSIGIFLGSSTVSPFWRNNGNKAGLREGQLIGVAGASVFNCGYAGIRIYHWLQDEPRELVAHFYGGKQVEI